MKMKHFYFVMPTVYLGPHIADMRESLVIMCSAHQIEKGKQSFIIMGYPEKGKCHYC